MPVTYSECSKETNDLLKRVMSLYHDPLVTAGLKVGLLHAYGPVNEDTGEVDGPAIKGHGNAPAAAKIKNVSLKDRLIKKYDVELLIDGNHWDDFSAAEQVALLDHELTHIQLTGDLDDLSRPKVKMRDEDFIVWGFLSVVRRHGAAALEAKSVKNLIDHHGQLLLAGWGEDAAPENLS